MHALCVPNAVLLLLPTSAEIMTDPSYKGQFVCFTHPHIGNVGINVGAVPSFPLSHTR